MRNFIPPEDSAHSGVDPSPPTNPVQELRLRIGIMSDCLTRVLDAAAGDILAEPSIAYLKDQLERLGAAYIGASKIVYGIAVLGELAAMSIDDFDEAEIVELSGIPTLPLDEKGGAS